MTLPLAELSSDHHGNDCKSAGQSQLVGWQRLECLRWWLVPRVRPHDRCLAPSARDRDLEHTRRTRSVELGQWVKHITYHNYCKLAARQYSVITCRGQASAWLIASTGAQALLIGPNVLFTPRFREVSVSKLMWCMIALSGTRCGSTRQWVCMLLKCRTGAECKLEFCNSTHISGPTNYMYPVPMANILTHLYPSRSMYISLPSTYYLLYCWISWYFHTWSFTLPSLNPGNSSVSVYFSVSVDEKSLPPKKINKFQPLRCRPVPMNSTS